MKKQFPTEDRDGFFDLSDFKELVKETTANLKHLSKMQDRMHWQFGKPEWYRNFVNELGETTSGWISSNC